MITSTSNQHAKWVRLLQTRRTARHDQGSFVIEGRRLLQEAVKAQVRVELVLHRADVDADTQRILNTLSRRGTQILPASENVLIACSDTETPQGLIAVVPVPKPIPADLVDPVLIVDRMRDPGNLGTLMRSSLAAGVALLVLTPGTVDVLNPKVVRGAMGAHFHLPFKSFADYDEIKPHLQGLKLWVAESGKGTRYDCVDWTQPAALLIGSEAHGPNNAALEWEHDCVHIPISRASESLNAAVAGSILLFEIVRQRGVQ